jgi:DNA polymerase III delta prime subunit
MTLEAFSAASNGDIRGAINALQFACLKGECSAFKSHLVFFKK